MKLAFADTLYWVAIVRPRDPWRQQAVDARAQLGRVHLVTTDEVLTEFVNTLSVGGEYLRGLAARMVQTIQLDPNAIVCAQSRQSFNSGLRLFEQRPDKGYSLTDCISMAVMKDMLITEVLTNDHHFTQEGFTVLIPAV